VIGIIDEVDGDDSRPRGVENRHGEASEQEVGGEFEPASVEGVQPVHDDIVTRRLVSFVADLPDGGLIDGCENDDSPDIVGIEGRTLDFSHRSGVITPATSSFTSQAESFKPITGPEDVQQPPGEMTEIFSEAMDGDDYPVLVPAIVLLVRWDILVADGFLRQCGASASEAGELRGDTHSAHFQRCVTPTSCRSFPRLKGAESKNSRIQIYRYPNAFKVLSTSWSGTKSDDIGVSC